MANKLSTSKLLTSDDYWAIWLGTFFLLVGIVLYLVIGQQSIGEELTNTEKVLTQQSIDIPFKTIEWYKSKDKKAQLTGANTPVGKNISTLFRKPKSWRENPLKSFLYNVEDISVSDLNQLEKFKNELIGLEIEANALAQEAKELGFNNIEKNNTASNAAEAWHQAYLTKKSS